MNTSNITLRETKQRSRKERNEQEKQELLNAKNRLNVMFDYLYNNGFVDSQLDFAHKINTSKGTVSHALSGYPDYLTQSLFKKIARGYADIFREEYVMTGKGAMLYGGSTTPMTVTTASDRQQRLRNIYTHLCQKGLIKNRTDMAGQLRLSKDKMARAFAGDTEILDDSFFSKIYSKFGQALDYQYVINGSGSVDGGVGGENIYTNNTPLDSVMKKLDNITRQLETLQAEHERQQEKMEKLMTAFIDLQQSSMSLIKLIKQQ